MTDFADAEAAIVSRLEANWTSTPLAVPGKPFAAQEAAWVKLEVLNFAEEQRSIGAPGDNLFRSEGLISIHVFVRKGTDAATSRTHAKALAALFRAQTFSGVICDAATISGLGEGSDDGKWARRTVTVPFSCDGVA